MGFVKLGETTWQWVPVLLIGMDGLPKEKEKKESLVMGFIIQTPPHHIPKSTTKVDIPSQEEQVSATLLHFKEKLQVGMAQTYFNVLQKSLPQHKKKGFYAKSKL